MVEICNKLNIPLVVSEHLKEFLIPNGFSKLNKRLIKETYNSCSAIIATSSVLNNSIINSFPIAKTKINIIPNPVDEEIFIQKMTDVKKKKYLSIICIALFRSEKRLDLVIQSFYDLLQSGENAKLTIIGDGPLKPEVINYIKKLNLSDFVDLKGYLSRNKVVKELHNNGVPGVKNLALKGTDRDKSISDFKTKSPDTCTDSGSNFFNPDNIPIGIAPDKVLIK